MIKVALTKSTEILKKVIQVMKTKNGGVVILTSKSYATLEPEFKRNKIALKNFLFIDTIGNKESDNVLPVSIKNLTALSITITEAMQSFPPNKKNLILESPELLLIYNSLEVTKKFLSFTIAQMRQTKTNTTIIVSKSSDSQKILPFLQQSED